LKGKESLKKSFGNVSYDKSQNGYYIWYITSREDIRKILDYFDRYPCQSVRGHRVAQIKAYYSLIEKGKEKRTQNASSPLYRGSKEWKEFAINWFKYTIK
jgi:uncharacterized protein YlbG (UPF0298 family)